MAFMPPMVFEKMTEVPFIRKTASLVEACLAERISRK